MRALLLPALLAITSTLDAAPDQEQLVMLQGDSAGEMAALVTKQNGKLSHKLDIINAVGAWLSRPQLEAILDSGKVTRHIEDLARPDQPLDTPPADIACQVAGAVEIEQSGNRLSWQIFNKESEARRLRGLQLRWPEALGRVQSITLGKHSLPLPAPSAGEPSVQLSLDTDSPVTVSGQQALTVTFSRAPQPSPTQRDYELKLDFGDDCTVGLIPGYPNNADNYYYSEVAGADALHRHGVRGQGVTVAVLDSGLWDHPHLEQDSQGRNRVKARYDAINDVEGSVFDESGHGSHLTSILAHSGATLEEGTATGGYKGIAPDAAIVAIKAFDESGKGALMDIVRGVQWVVENREKYDIRVLNLSFAAQPRWPYFLDPINQAVMRAWAEGITVVAAAGNSGPELMTVGAPANVPYVISVGAVTDSWTTDTRADDYIPGFSSRGPTPDAHIKPDIVAPGGHMTGLTRPGSGLTKEHPEYQLPGGELVMTGTSQAAALVSGLVALLIQLQPDLSPDDIKCKLLSTAEPAIDENGLLAYSPFEQGYGLVSITRAITLGEVGCGNEGLDLSKDLAGEEHFEGPAIVTADQQISLPGLDAMVSPEPPAKGISATRVWGVKNHVERLAPDYRTPPGHPFNWVQRYEAERRKIEKLSKRP